MRRAAIFAAITGLVLPFMAVSPGCSNNEKAPDLGAKKFPLAAKQEKRTALEVQDRGAVVTGRILFDGEPPPPERIARIELHGDKVTCNKGGPMETSRQTWFVNKETRGLRYVVVWLEPPAGKFFPVPEEDRRRQGDRVVIDQPHCAFIPHVVSLFPSYFDGAKLVHTGQMLEVKNSSPILHTVQWDPSRDNEPVSHNLPPRASKEFALNPQKKFLAIGCGAHNWMVAILWIFDHPYHAVSAEDGTFQIKNVPADVELTFKAWHESRPMPFEIRKMTFKKGENPPVELKLTAK